MDNIERKKMSESLAKINANERLVQEKTTFNETLEKVRENPNNKDLLEELKNVCEGSLNFCSHKVNQWADNWQDFKREVIKVQKEFNLIKEEEK